MKRGWIVGGLIAFALAIIGITKTTTPWLVSYVVCNAMQQKAPPEFPSDKIRRGFFLAYEESRADKERQQRYVETLFSLSQKLEKVQRLSLEETEELLSLFLKLPER